ncbi:hypothetical protein CMEL01_09580 [Colletotrichum melonis]|uniref:Uncharacterized protein n=1 Tax=Colletotrichum melonis TaxID=1209925 RepID=A0AAI9TZW1_9PEZI|nr:hypothetical protein CMEL01_09580 [Colletotrichum melonis]
MNHRVNIELGTIRACGSIITNRSTSEDTAEILKRSFASHAIIVNPPKPQKRTTPGIRWSSPTQLLIRPSLAYLWESGRDPEFSNGYGRM